jgi:diguanylate cyclase (GGDEF)-like protein/PAS domain S-box-containing protein
MDRRQHDDREIVSLRILMATPKTIGALRIKIGALRGPFTLHLGSLRLAMTSGCIVFGLQAIVQALYPRIWTSHSNTALFTFLLAGACTFIFLNKEKKVHFERTVNEKHYRLLFERSSSGIFRATLDGHMQDCNDAFCRILGYTSRDELLGGSRESRGGSNLIKFIYTLQFVNSVTNFEHSLQRRDGSLVWVLGNATLLASADGFGRVIEGTLIEISERKRSEEILRNSENKYRVLFEESADANWLMDEKGFLDCNSAALKMFGYAAVTEMIHPANISPPNQPDGTLSRAAAEQNITAAVLNGKQRFEWIHQRKNGVTFPAEVCLTKLTLTGRPKLLATVRDITERKLAEERVQFLAYCDALTGLPNRPLLQDRLSKALASARRQNGKLALLFLDLDRFKNINDSLGHSFGDLLLQQVAERLKRFAREQDTVARLGGDEFLIVLTSVKDIHHTAVAAERLMDVLTAEFVVQGHTLSVNCSLGISIFPEHGTNAETLIKNADAAMYSAKDAGRNNFQFFSEEMNTQVVERLTLENSLRLSLEKKELFLVYQPQINIVTGQITGLEALLRWKHPDLGLVSPDKFIRIAENCGLMGQIGEWVLMTACSQAQKWQEEGLPAVQVAVNVSAVQFCREGFCDLIRKVLEETRLAAQYLELELTESLLLANADVTFAVLQELKAMGLKLAIDDFGTGYSSFSYLRQFQVSKLKIDRSFIRDVAINFDDAAITAAIIGMAKSLRLKVIAEGVENEAQMSFLRSHQCDEIQGYYFSEPLTPERAADKLRDVVVQTFSASGGT